MFEYDRLALNVAEQICKLPQAHASAQTQAQAQPQKSGVARRKTNGRAGGISPPAIKKNSAPLTMNGLLNEYCQYLQHQQKQHHSGQLFTSKSVDSGGEENSRRLSGGSNSYGDCGAFDCGASSGYGSPGVGGTPLASPAPNSAHYFAHQLQRMLDNEVGEQPKDLNAQNVLTMMRRMQLGGYEPATNTTNTVESDQQQQQWFGLSNTNNHSNNHNMNRSKLEEFLQSPFGDLSHYLDDEIAWQKIGESDDQNGYDHIFGTAKFSPPADDDLLEVLTGYDAFGRGFGPAGTDGQSADSIDKSFDKSASSTLGGSSGGGFLFDDIYAMSGAIGSVNDGFAAWGGLPAYGSSGRFSAGFNRSSPMAAAIGFSDNFCANSDGKLSTTPSDGGSSSSAAARLTTVHPPSVSPVGGAPVVAIEDGFSAAEIAQFAQLLCSPKKAPPQRYQCHICYQPGHYISDCPMRFNSPYEELTPYQGRKKCYGEFQCQLCKRKWTSQNSVANEAQSCIKCHVPVFPHKQLPVDKAIALGLVKSHRVVPTKITPIGHGRPPAVAAAIGRTHHN